MESGELSLEESLKAFELGMSLSKDCQQALADAELKVQQLTADLDATDPA
jgi:exodeoxyribonuclease VII small subunit